MINETLLTFLRGNSRTEFSNIPEEEIEMAYREYEKAIEEEERRHREQLEEEEEEDYDDEEEEEEEEGGDSSPSYRFYGTKIDRRWSGRSRRSSNNGQQIVHFYVSLPLAIDSNSSRVVEATSRFWKRGVSSQNSNASLSSTTIPVSFYRLDDIPRGKFRYTKLDPIFITTKNVSIYGNEWVELDMINAIRAWMNSPKSDTGILIKCPDCDAAGVKFLTGSHRKGPEGTTKVPRLDVRTEIVGLRRVKRSRKMRKSLKKNIRHHADCHDATHPRGKRSNRCCRRSMQVRFADLPRFDFILSPKEFDAYYCSGKCPARYNPANEHALLQSLLNLRGKNNVPGPCCAPTKLKGLNILHIGDDGRIKTTFWRDVIVTECGCA
ncbi:Protein decapentaplegic [Armadillidium vulgare]|nr:Protein decapentaplegic [Armadillidium vulgare]